ncbi:hypothetical protein L2E82_20305 [Cichorium intybus]|uniref:Uncharacterized protein n=1 Tax=Cichorium intybus TaxID=13427 RepID=A0ACB9DSQ4_CICIN|nr:hypothetical protein L2E82_20305 [Cichorium intybus]
MHSVCGDLLFLLLLTRYLSEMIACMLPILSGNEPELQSPEASLRLPLFGFPIPPLTALVTVRTVTHPGRRYEIFVPLD